MKRVLSSFLMFLVLVCPAFGADWTPIAEQLLKSVVTIEISRGSDQVGACTGWVINNPKDLLVTANHCDAEKDQVLTADGQPTKVIFKDIKNDLLVLEVDDLDRPALRIAKDDPRIGEEVASLGYGYALDRPMFRVTHVSDNKAHLGEIGGPWILTDTTFVPGMSGGPVVDINGNVVMMVQRGSDTVGIGRGAEILRNKLGRFQEATK